MEDIPPETMLWVKIFIAAIIFVPALIFVRFALFLILPKSVIHFLTGKKKVPEPGAGNRDLLKRRYHNRDRTNS